MELSEAELGLDVALLGLQLVVADEVRVEDARRVARILGLVLQPQPVDGRAARQRQLVGHHGRHAPVQLQRLLAAAEKPQQQQQSERRHFSVTWFYWVQDGFF